MEVQVLSSAPKSHVLDLLTAPLLSEHGFRHGFNTRRGGISRSAFASLNLGRAVGDDPQAVAENRRRFARAVGYGEDDLHELSQVHGAAVRSVAQGGESPAVLRREQGDALVAPSGGLAIGVRVADCVALLLADPESGCVAAVHAGWRGTVAGVVEASVSALCARADSTAARLLVASFPHIRRCCFEVGEDVAEQLKAASPNPDVVDRTRARPHIDLQSIVAAKLGALGVPSERVQDVAGCTCCDEERFFSFRRDGTRSGRHVAAIVSR